MHVEGGLSAPQSAAASAVCRHGCGRRTPTGGGGRGHNPTSSHAVHRSREGWPALHITWFRGSMARPGQVVGGAQVKSHGAAGRALRAAGGGGGACRPTLTPPPSLTQRAQHSRRNICVGVRLGGVVSTIACKGRHHPRCSHEG